MKRVLLESPFSSPTIEGVEVNKKYARLCVIDSLKRNEAPFASHLLYTQCLDDTKENERKMGMEAGFAYIPIIDKSVVYVDKGISKGMSKGISLASKQEKHIEYRRLDPPPSPFYILISGKRGCGKDTLAEYIKILLPSATITGFANTAKYEYAQTLSNDPVEVQTIYHRLLTDYKYKESQRERLIELTKVFKREYGDTVWVKKLQVNTSSQKIVIIPDMRFKYEFHYPEFTKLNSVKIRIKCDNETRVARGFVRNESVDTDASECDLDDIPDDTFDYFLLNNGTKDELMMHTHTLVNSLCL